MRGERKTSPLLDALIADLEGWDYEVTSEPTDAYNCIAFALGDESTWWDPNDEDAYWPEDVPREHSLSTYVRVFELAGYCECDDDALEDGFDKIAIQEDERGLIHATRQVDALMWKSKLGRLHDIRHPLNALVQEYGAVQLFMRRPKPREDR